jgi:hypothetical protein
MHTHSQNAIQRVLDEYDSGNELTEHLLTLFQTKAASYMRGEKEVILLKQQHNSGEQQHNFRNEPRDSLDQNYSNNHGRNHSHKDGYKEGQSQGNDYGYKDGQNGHGSQSYSNGLPNHGQSNNRKYGINETRNSYHEINGTGNAHQQNHNASQAETAQPRKEDAFLPHRPREEDAFLPHRPREEDAFLPHRPRGQIDDWHMLQEVHAHAAEQGARVYEERLRQKKKEYMGELDKAVQERQRRTQMTRCVCVYVCVCVYAHVND